MADPMLAVWRSLREQILVLDKQLNGPAKADPMARRLMSISGAGGVVALAYIAVVDDPERFRR